ncbi:hypothetical protein [Legionella fairfieldensis]|uniref:hypothetical protein n=1 Tax=Legionella fairfieldensis TaxID=45064 RepID=UPI00048CF031|nr:hypothetical protein [Legionella fairfieldensis]
MVSSKEKIKRLLIVCQNYYNHLDKKTISQGWDILHTVMLDLGKDELKKGKKLTSFSKVELSEFKQSIVITLMDILHSSKNDDTKIIYVDLFLRTKSKEYGYMTPASILATHHSSVGMRFLESIFHILTLGVYSQITKGTFAFWRTDGEVAFNAIKVIINTP